MEFFVSVQKYWFGSYMDQEQHTTIKEQLSSPVPLLPIPSLAELPEQEKMSNLMKHHS